MWFTIRPISSAWPAIITVGEPSGLISANAFPWMSVHTRSAKSAAASRHAAVASVS